MKDYYLDMIKQCYLDIANYIEQSNVFEAKRCTIDVLKFLKTFEHESSQLHGGEPVKNNTHIYHTHQNFMAVFIENDADAKAIETFIKGLKKQ